MNMKSDLFQTWWYKLTINLFVTVSLIHVSYLFRVEMEIK